MNEDDAVLHIARVRRYILIFKALTVRPIHVPVAAVFVRHEAGTYTLRINGCVGLEDSP